MPNDNMKRLEARTAAAAEAALAARKFVTAIDVLQGIGWLGYDATLRSDLPVVQAITLLVAAVYIGLTLAADLLNAALDPRIRVR